MLTTQQIADEFGVAYQTVMSWIYKGLFPNAQKEETPRGSYYLVPRGDLTDFKPQKRGRPPKPVDEGKGLDSQTAAAEKSLAKPMKSRALKKSGDRKASKTAKARKAVGKER